MNDPSQMINRSYGIWPPAAAMEDPMGFQNPRPMVFTPGAGAMQGRMNWKGKKVDKRMKGGPAGGPGPGGGDGVQGGYKPPTLNELQSQNRAKARRFYPKKKFGRFAPFAPRNTTSFIIRAKKSGGIASLVSPCPVTPAILPTPKFSPSREGLVDMAKEEWGVDGYGSMKGLIRLRSPTRVNGEEEEVEEGEGSSESDVEEHLEVERRLDHDLSRFEMVYPSFGEDAGAAAAASAAYVLENRVDDQDTHIAQLEEENLTLKERLFLMEREMGELRRRLQRLETEYLGREEKNDHSHNNNVSKQKDGDGDGDGDGEENENVVVVEEGSENEKGDVCSEKSVGDCDEIGHVTPVREL
ncbi:hypothetical protein J5N97_023687 [Dioscorea zingiberensis]|uniref:PRLI-interacting factor A n=1 Tax=Dioscorea zingiberensis TaxID=325984 RepID=A0A9D5C5B3_9LILI|nr:hypothetical protein J5N97_023687 [Dioscorea zingiberensis]